LLNWNVRHIIITLHVSTRHWKANVFKQAGFGPQAGASTFSRQYVEWLKGYRMDIRMQTHNYWNTVPPSYLYGTHLAMICMIQRLALTVSDVCLKHRFFLSSSTYNRGIVLYVLHKSTTYLLHESMMDDKVKNNNAKLHY